MKAKNIMMTLLLVTGAIAAKASGYPPELALVSQPVMVYNYNSITVYYDVENIGDYTYRGYVDIYLDPDNGYSYAEEYVRVAPGRIKRIALEIPAYRPSPSRIYTIMPYYELGGELYSFTTFEYFEPLTFYWDGPRNERWVVFRAPARLRYYHRPGTYRYYYDGYRPIPVPGYGPGMLPPPMNPMHHTYGYHSNNGYPANHPEWNNTPAPNNHNEGASVRPKANGGSMSSGSYNSGNNPPAPNNGANTRPKDNNGSNSGRVGNNSNSNNRPSGTTNNGSSSGRVNNSNSNRRPSGTSNSGSSSGRVNNSSNNSRPTGTSNSGSSSGRVGNSSNNSRSSGTSSANTRTGNSSSSRGSNSSRSGAGTRGR